MIAEAQSEADDDAVEALLDAGFGISRRIKTSYRLREGSQAANGLSFVVRDAEGFLAGALSFWPLAIGKAGTPALLLGPIAIHPQRQNKGYGRFLISTGIERAIALGHALIVLVGDQPYYAPFQFSRVPDGKLTLPGPFVPERFLYRELQAGAFEKAQGLVVAPWRWPEAFSAPRATTSG